MLLIQVQLRFAIRLLISFLISMGRHDSKSPIQAYGSPPVRKSPSRRERSPTRHRTLNSDKLSSRNRSPKDARSRSREPHSPAGVKGNNRRRHPEHRKSPPPISLSTVRKKPYDQMRSQKNEKSRPSPPTSPAKGKLSSRIGPSKRVQSRSSSPERTKSSIQVKSSKRARSRSPDSHSLSPRSRRLKRVHGERDTKKGNVKENEKNHSRKGEEKGSGRDLGVGNRRSELDVSGNTLNDFRSRHSRMCSRPRSPYGHHNDGERKSRSPGAADMRGHIELRSPRDPEQRNGGGKDSVAKMKAVEETLDAKEKVQQKPSFELSGKLAAETNRVRGVTLLFNEPPDARKPDIRWRLYVFKGGEVLNEPLYVHRQSCYLFGRERRVADIPTDHPSCSKQHAVLQYRQVEEGREDGSMSKQVRPYLMDLGSTNGTSINDNKIEPQRYYELFEKDTIKFGNSSREYVLLHQNSSG